MEKIVLGVCSSVSLYKACEVLRGFQKKGFEVYVIMTKNAAKLISPRLFQALTGHPVFMDPFEENLSQKIAHIDLARDLRLLLVAPATANMIGKLASGIADDFLSTFYMAVDCPVALAPAMNERMYFHSQTQENIRKLKACGVSFIEPERGYLACGEEAWGRLADPEDIVEQGLGLIDKSTSFQGKTVLVTAGPTREPLDPVRFLTTRSSGKMGYALAEEARRRGAKVILVSGPCSLPAPPRAELRNVQTAQEMQEEVMRFSSQADVILMAAAVSDFKFLHTSSYKIKKERPVDKIELVKTPDILKEVGGKKGKKIVVGFAAETEDVEKNARNKLKQKNLDMIVANDVSRQDIGFDSDMNQVSIFHKGGKATHTEKRSKLEISRIILDEVEDIIARTKK